MADKLAEAYVEVSARLDSLEKDFRQGVAMTERETAKMSSVGSQAMGMATTGLIAAGVAGTAAIGAAAAGVASIVQEGIRSFASFEKGMNEVFTLLPGISKDAMDKMSDQVLAFSKDMAVLPEEVVPALYQALSAGVPPDNVFDFLETAQQAAKGGVADLQTSVDALSSVVNAYGSEAMSAGEASDLLFTAVRLGKTSFPELSKSIFQVTPTAAALGVEFGNVTAALAAITAQGTPTAVATTQLRQLFVELSKEGGKTSETFQQLAGKTFKEFIAEGNSLADALALMEEHAKETGVGVNDLFGSVEAGSAALQLTGGGAEKFNQFIDEMGESAGATEAAYTQMTQGVSQQFDRLQASISAAFIKIGEGVSPSLGPIVDTLLELVTMAEEELTPAFAAIGEALGTIDPDASGARSLFVAVADGLVLIVDSLLGVATVLDDLSLDIESIVKMAKQLAMLNPVYLAATAVSAATGESRSERGQNVAEILERLRAARDELAKQPPEQKETEPQKKLKESIDALTDATEDNTKQEESKPSVDPIEQAMLEKSMREMEEDRQRIMGLEGPQQEKLAEQGFIGFAEFGKRLQEQILGQEREQKEEAFRRKVEEFEKEKQKLLERNADGTDRIAKRLEEIKTAR